MFVMIFVTCKDRSEAKLIANHLLEKKLIACANIIDSVKSMFWWNDRIEQSDEVLILLKAKDSDFLEIESTVSQLHSYDVPEILALPIIEGKSEYLNWVEKSTEK